MIEKRPFGRTGHLSTAVIFGGAALGRASQAEADQILDRLLEYGINHIDTAASYGQSELRIAPWLKKHRAKFFLATKTGKRTYVEAKEEFHRSLERLGVDSVDLIQLHNLAEREEWEIAMGPSGALEAVIEAREQGLVRFIGVTGHGTGIATRHLRSLAHFDFDSVLLPYNYPLMQNQQYAADFEALTNLCSEREIAVQTIKSIARRPWNEQERNRNTWYQPLEDQADIDTAVNWVLGRPRIFLNMVGDVNLQPKVLEAASRLGARPSEADMAAVINRLDMEPLFV